MNQEAILFNDTFKNNISFGVAADDNRIVEAAKIANAVTDTAVTMAVKSALRVSMPVVLSLATNDALGASCKNIGLLMNTKNIYFVPLGQDDPIKKPNSLVAHFDLIPETLANAVLGEQLQPVLR